MTTPPGTPPPQVPWWLPIVYTAFGACLGFVFARFQGWLEKRAARKSFLLAVRVELATMNDHLKGTLKDATEYKERFDKGDRSLLYLATAFQRGIYDTQINKLKSVTDPLVIEVVQIYDKLPNLERVKSHVFSVSFELTGLPPEQRSLLPNITQR